MIYYVEDDASIRDLVLYTLTQAGYQAMGFPDGAAFTAACARTLPRLILLDIMLPGEDGLSLLRRLRESPETRAIPVILITAKGTEYDKVVGLDGGADDYIAKPFGMMEFLARVRAAYRRGAPTADDDGTLERGVLRMDLTRRLVFSESQPVQLTFKEFELLRLLLAHPGRVYSREQLLSKVWGYDYAGGTRTVDVHIQTLRQKLGKADAIETVRGVGYKLREAEPR